MGAANVNTKQATQKKQVVIVAMTRLLMLDFAGPADVFNYADACLQETDPDAGYEVIVVSPTSDKLVATATGIEIRCRLSAMEVELPVDTLIIAGNDFSETSAPAFEPFYQWLSTINEHNTH